MPPAICPANAHEECDSLNMDYGIIVKRWSVCYLLCENHESAVFRLAFIK
ncbi:MAG: hypothetical protein JJE22_13310 [Bacteroidia bacterium]|nr:hypothetical protein [Bacteroidia bacterium]